MLLAWFLFSISLRAKFARQNGKGEANAASSASAIATGSRRRFLTSNPSTTDASAAEGRMVAEGLKVADSVRCTVAKGESTSCQQF